MNNLYCKRMKQKLLNLVSVILMYLLYNSSADNLECRYGSYWRLLLHITDGCCFFNTTFDISILEYDIRYGSTLEDWTPSLGWKDVIGKESVYIHYYNTQPLKFITEKHCEITRIENMYQICMIDESEALSYTLKYEKDPFERMFVNFSHTSLEELSVYTSDDTIYVHTPRLKRLYVRNHIGDYGSYLKFSEQSQKSVTYLHFDEPVLTPHYDFAFFLSEFTSLNVLKFSHVYTDAAIVPPDVQLSSVTTLDYSHAGINALKENVFSIFPSVVHLDLTGNMIERVHEDTFLPLIHLKVLDMSESLHTKKLSLQFSTKEAIELIDLSKNNLTSVSIFTDKGVKSLNLSHNKLSKDISIKCCSAKECVINLSLQNNLIEISEDFFTLFEGVQSVDIINYKLNCLDCDMLKSKAVERYIENNIGPKYLFHTNNSILTCTEPEFHSGTSIINTIDINRICKGDSIDKNYWKSHKILIISVVAIVLAFILLITGIVYKFHFEIPYWIQYINMKRSGRRISQCDTEGFDYDAFICYCAADRLWVWNVLKKSLEESVQKYCLYLHERNFSLRAVVDENIENSLKKSKYCIIITSNSFIANQWCLWELEVASTRLMEERKTSLILIQLEHLDTSNIPTHLKHLISTRTYLEWNTKKFSEKSLLERLKKALGESIYEKNLQSRFDIDVTEL